MHIDNFVPARVPGHRFKHGFIWEIAMLRMTLATFALVSSLAPAAADTKRDVRGVELGMDLNQAQAALEQKGATCRKWETSRECRFEDKSKIELSHNVRNKHVVTRIDFTFEAPETTEAGRKFIADTVIYYNLTPGSSSGDWHMPDGSSLVISPLGDALSVLNRDWLADAERGVKASTGGQTKP